MKSPKILLLILVVMAVAVAVFIFEHKSHAPLKSKQHLSIEPQPRQPFGFEDGDMGWMPQTYPGSQACSEVSSSDEQAKEGQRSLKLSLHLVGGDASYSCGEAFVLLGPGDGTQDLKGRTLTAWVYAPEGAKGDADKPNGWQLFVKDGQWHNEYGTWSNLVEGQWIQLSLKIGSDKPVNGWIDPGFNPDQIICVGVRIVAPAGSTAKYDGPIYLDAVNW